MSPRLKAALGTLFLCFLGLVVFTTLIHAGVLNRYDDTLVHPFFLIIYTMVALPPLVFFSFATGEGTALSAWKTARSVLIFFILLQVTGYFAFQPS